MSSTLDYPSIRSLFAELKSLLEEPENVIASNRMAAMDAARKLTEALDTPQHAIAQHRLMSSIIPCTKIAVDLNLFGIIAQDKSRTKTAAELGEHTGAEPTLIVRIMRVLTAEGFAKETDEATYASTPKTEEMTKPTNIAALKHAFNLNVKANITLPDFLHSYGYKNQDGSSITPFQYAHDTKLSYFEYMQQHPAIADNFNTVMQGVRGDRVNWIDWFPVQEEVFDEVNKDKEAVLMIDFGGGKGHDLMAFRKKFPSAPGRMMLQDQPHVVQTATLEDGVEKMAHDIFTPQPIKGARLYFEHYVLHDWDDEKCINILKNIASAMTPGYSKLYLNEWILPNTGCSLFEAMMDITMLTALGGMERSESQWRELLRKAGLKAEKFWHPAGFGEGIIEVSV